MDIQEIMKYLPHRYPILLVDRIVEVEPRKRCVGIKNVSINEPHFQGHYPGIPIMPGVLIIEAMAQTGAVILLSDPELEGMIPLIGGMSDVKFRRQVVPGDQLRMEIDLLKLKGTVGKMSGKALVDNQVVAELELTFKLMPKG